MSKQIIIGVSKIYYEITDQKTQEKRSGTSLTFHLLADNLPNTARYVLVPELHKKGGIHCHLLTNNVFELIDSGTRLIEGRKKPVKLSTLKYLGLEDKIKAIVYNIPDWKYGFNTAIKTYGGTVRLAKYVTKYLTKDSERIFGRNYWSSRNVVRQPKILYFDEPDFDSLKAHKVEVPFIGVSFAYRSSYSYDEQTKRFIELDSHEL